MSELGRKINHFAMKYSTQERYDFYFGHNITESALNLAAKNGAALVGGSFYVATKPLTKYGSFTLVPDNALRDEIVQEVYDCDIYSPRAPKFSFDVNPDKLRSAVDAINQIIRKDTELGIEPVDGNDIKRLLSDGGIKDMQQKGVSISLLLACARDSNIPIELPMNSDELPEKWRVYQDSCKLVSRLQQIKSSDHDFDLKSSDGMRIAKEELEFANQLYIDLDISPNPFTRFVEGKDKRSNLRLLLSSLDRDLTASSNEVNKNELSNLLFSNSELIASYNDWIERSFSKVLTQAYITLDNEARVEATPENILLSYNERKNEGEGFHYGIGNLRALFAKNLDSYQLLSDNSHKLQMREYIEEDFKKLETKFDSVVDSLRAHCTSNVSDVPKVFVEAMRNYETLGSVCLMDDFERELVLSDDFISELDELIDELSNAPTEYFEAKMYSSIPLNRFVLVAPDNADKNTISAMKEAGITKVVNYSYGIEESFNAAMSKVLLELKQEHKVSLSNKVGPLTPPKPSMY